MAIQTDYSKRTINEMVLHFQHGQINLEPGFQRKSVWSLMDRRRLIQSIVSEYPLPNIFLYRRSSRGQDGLRRDRRQTASGNHPDVHGDRPIQEGPI